MHNYNHKQMIQTLICIILPTSVISFNGILMNGLNGTHIFIPGEPDKYVSNINFALPHVYSSAGVLLNGDAYFLGGLNLTTNTFTNTMTIFNAATNTTTEGQPFHTARGGHAATAVNNTIIMCGGTDDKERLSSCEKYVQNSKSVDKWKPLPALPTPNYLFTMVTLNNQVYTFGGYNHSDIPCFLSNAVYMFDGYSWIERAHMPVSTSNHASVAIDNDRVLVCGGYQAVGSSCAPVAHCYIYSATLNKWTSAPSMARERFEHEMITLSGLFVMFIYLFYCYRTSKHSWWVYVVYNGRTVFIRYWWTAIGDEY
jgi:hypothetical protein